MGSYSIADAKNGLPGLIDRALSGEHVVITRHGKAVVELRPALPSTNPEPVSGPSLAWLRSRRLKRPKVDVTAVDVLRDVADETRW